MKGLFFPAVFVIAVHLVNTKDNQSLGDPSSARVSKDVSLLSDRYEAELGRHERDADKKRKLQTYEKQKTKPKQRSKQRVNERNKKKKVKGTKRSKGKKRKGNKTQKKKKGNKKKKGKNKNKKKKKKKRQNNAIVEKKPHEGPYGYMHPEEIDVRFFLNFGTLSNL